MSKYQYENLSLEWLGHSGFRISSGAKVIYIDPYKIDEHPYPADLVIVTHEHFDHCASENIQKLMKRDTIVVAPQNCLTKLAFVPRQNLKLIPTNFELAVGRVQLKTLPAYNIKRFRSPNVPFHQKGYGYGVVLTIDGVVIYHAGDTDLVPEMRELKDIDIALLPVGGTYTMDANEAAQAVHEIKPKVAIPMHWGAGVVGLQADAEAFKALVGNSYEVIIL
jgi:L-ascorbate metabolism protein UlaG (beta-lactamase superfamily)